MCVCVLSKACKTCKQDMQWWVCVHMYRHVCVLEWQQCMYRKKQVFGIWPQSTVAWCAAPLMQSLQSSLLAQRAHASKRNIEVPNRNTHTHSQVFFVPLVESFCGGEASCVHYMFMCTLVVHLYGAHCNAVYSACDQIGIGSINQRNGQALVEKRSFCFWPLT